MTAPQAHLVYEYLLTSFEIFFLVSLYNTVYSSSLPILCIATLNTFEVDFEYLIFAHECYLSNCIIDTHPIQNTPFY